MPAALIIYAIFAITISNLLSKQLYQPIWRIENEIESFGKGETTVYQPVSKNEILEFKNLEEFLIKAFAVARQKTAAERELAEVAAHAAHDICSPLMALQITYEQIPNLSPEQSSFLKKANESISEIAHDLLAKYSAYKDIIVDRVTTEENIISTYCPSDEKPPEPINIANLIEEFVHLKKVQFSNVKNINFIEHINDNAKKLLSRVNPIKLERILSNIANNAVEAITDANREQGTIDITLEKTNHFIAIIISDNGTGMPQELINKLGIKEYSENKKGGHGIGIFSAIKQIKVWQGNYKIVSEVNKGTKFSIYLPII